MAKYGSGLTSGQIANMEKDEIKHALQGKVAVGDGEGGFVYAEMEKAECDRVVLKAYDALYFQLEKALASGRALEKIAKDHGYMFSIKEYEKALEDTAVESDYNYEEADE